MSRRVVLAPPNDESLHLISELASRRAEGSASDEAHPSEENQRADGSGVTIRDTGTQRAEGSASDEAHPSEENQRADERGRR